MKTVDSIVHLLETIIEGLLNSKDFLWSSGLLPSKLTSLGSESLVMWLRALRFRVLEIFSMQLKGLNENNLCRISH